MSKHLAIIGGGSWGTALSIVLAPRFESVGIWVHDAGLAATMARTRENHLFLPGFEVPSNVVPTGQLEVALADAQIVLGVMPSKFVRATYGRMLPYLQPGMRFVSATKGLEQDTLLRMSEVMRDVITTHFEAEVAVLSGPTFAREVASGDPAAVVISAERHEVAAYIQHAFSGPSFRLYTNSDPVGVEIAASLKNVIAIGAGVCEGLGLGTNPVAALVTRGLAEITRLAVQMGGSPSTLSGLAGLGDLVLTCTGGLSRNRQVGIELGRGRKLDEILASMTMVAEGVETTAAAVGLGRRFAVELPIIEEMDAILRGAKTPRQAIRDLMERRLRSE